MRRLIARLKNVQQVIAGGAGEICARAAGAAADGARGYVPVDTGALKNSISSGSTGPLAAAAAASAPHAAYVEYGTSRMAAQSYMLPGARSAREGFFSDMRALAKRAAKG